MTADPIAQVKEALTPFARFAEQLGTISTFHWMRLEAADYDRVRAALPALDTLGEELAGKEAEVAKLERVLAALTASYNTRGERSLALASSLAKCQDALREATAELIYLRQYGRLGAKWEANESKDVWRAKADAALGEAPAPAGETRRSLRHIGRALRESVRQDPEYQALVARIREAEQIAAARDGEASPPPDREDAPTQEELRRAEWCVTMGLLNFLPEGISEEMLGNAPTVLKHTIARNYRAATPTAPDRAADALREAAERVCWFDWSDNDSDAVRAINDLRAALSSGGGEVDRG